MSAETVLRGGTRLWHLAILTSLELLVSEDGTLPVQRVYSLARQCGFERCAQSPGAAHQVIDALDDEGMAWCHDGLVELVVDTDALGEWLSDQLLAAARSAEEGPVMPGDRADDRTVAGADQGAAEFV